VAASYDFPSIKPYRELLLIYGSHGVASFFMLWLYISPSDFGGELNHICFLFKNAKKEGSVCIVVSSSLAAGKSSKRRYNAYKIV
jgi:hypothetical protein